MENLSETYELPTVLVLYDLVLYHQAYNILWHHTPAATRCGVRLVLYRVGTVPPDPQYLVALVRADLNILWKSCLGVDFSPVPPVRCFVVLLLR